MQTSMITVKTESQLKAKAQKLADEMGLTLTAVVNRYLRHFVTTKEITFYGEEKPSKYLLGTMKQAKKDLKAGKASPVFDNRKDELRWLEKQGI
jgi:addiction module RelB/DinJ family antitoxin